MFATFRHAFALALLLCMLHSVPAADDTMSREAIARHAKDSTVLVEVKPTYGTGFCVHSSGLFVTNEHVVRQGEIITLVLHAGQKAQKLLKAKVVRRDKALDLALLRVEGEEKFQALELGSDKDLSELTEVIACGFPFGTQLATKGGYPAISINVGSVTSLRNNKDGELHRIQLDAALNPGNSGGPVLNRQGKVVGMVVSGIVGSGVNMAIPVGNVQRFLSRPDIDVTLPFIQATNQHGAYEFTAKATSLLPAKDALELELVLGAGARKDRRFPMKFANGVYRASAVPFPAPMGPSMCRLDIKYEDGSISGAAEDRTIRIGEMEIKLSQMRNLCLEPKVKARLSDGRQLDGKLSGLEAIPLTVGKQSLRLDLAGALEVNVEPLEEITELACAVVARQAGREVGRHDVLLHRDGNAQSGVSSEWTLDLKKMRPLDGPVKGKIMGKDFAPDTMQLQNSMMTLQSGTDRIQIFNLVLKPGKMIYEFSADDKQLPSRRPMIQIHMMPPAFANHPNGYAMRLEFGAERDGQVPTKLYLCLPDDKKSFIAGSFMLEIEGP
jgi:hypothetical protein